MSEFTKAKEHAKDLEISNGQRNSVYTEMENLYWMDWGEEDAVRRQLENHKITRTPRARNAIIGAKRLLIATDPIVSVPSDTNKPATKVVADKMEKFLKAELNSSGRFSGNPIHYDAVLSALLYSDVVIGISSTKEMLKYAGGSSKAVQRRLKAVSERTPILFEIYNPKNCYAERDSMGLVTFFRKVKVTAGWVMDHWGSKGMAAIRSSKNKKLPERNVEFTLCDYYDLEYRHVWLDECDEPIFSEKHELPAIPIAYAVAEGSKLFDKPELQREPFLYTAWKSGIIDRENMILTVLYTMLFSIGSNPMFVDYLHDPDRPHPVDWSVAGGTVHYRVGERREVMSRQVIDPAMMEAWNMANDLEMQSTLYRQALGEPISASTPFSSYSLMSQSGRLPLVAVQRLVSHALAEALEISLVWIKDEGGSVRSKYMDISAELQASEIPDNVEVSVKLEVDLPQDRLQLANAANMISQGEKPLASRRWSRENILNIGQSGDMTKEIWDENMADLLYQKMVYEEMAKLAQMKQMAMQPPQMQGSGMPGGMQGPPIQQAGPMMPTLPGQGPNFGTPGQPPIPEGPAEPQPVPPVPPMMPEMGEVPEDEMMGGLPL